MEISKAVFLCCLALSCFGQSLCAQSPEELFESRIRPVLIERCIACHGPQKSESGLRLDSRNGWKRGGDRGPAIVPHDADSSLLIKAISYTDDELLMPPEDHGGRLTDRQIAEFRAWIAAGAFDPRSESADSVGQPDAAREHWAFQPLQRSEIPAGIHPLDALIERKIRAAGMVTAPAADARTAIRRAVFDLLGLPPTAEQLAIGAEDFSQLIDLLLSSSQYGERWARHWLDVARYADTKDGVLMYGDGRMRPFAYTYRDYVIRSFNDDKPYDRFILEQLAADQLELPDDSSELAAMGFLTLGRMFDNNQHDVIDDQIDVVARGLLGITVSCARCHDHKFDPIPTADYYSLYGVFASSWQPLERPRIEPVTTDREGFERELASKIAAVKSMRSEQHQLLIRAAQERVADYLVKVATTQPDVSETSIFFLSLLPDDLRPQIVNRWRRLIADRRRADDPIFGPWHDFVVHGSFADPPALAAAWRQRGIDERIVRAILTHQPDSMESLAKAYGAVFREVAGGAAAGSLDHLSRLILSPESPGWFSENQTYYYLSRHEKDRYSGMVNELDLLATRTPVAAARAMVLTDAEELYQPVIFRRGDPTQPGNQVPRQFLQILSPHDRIPFAHGSGRLDLARSIASPDNPLTARVWVNRIWMHHFGESLVDNPGDFGLRTEKPLHLDVLDHLATELIRNNWQMKPLHKLIMTSAAYRRTSIVTGDPQQLRQQKTDPGNRLLWRANRRRLDLEAMRDSMLMISGQLDSTMYGRPNPIDDPANFRRTIYATVERQSVPTIVRVFDVANADASVARRTMTTVPQQALFVMNSPFVTKASAALVSRLTGSKDAERIQQLYDLVLGRQPTSEELAAGRDFVANGAWDQYAQVLLMTNELMFVD